MLMNKKESKFKLLHDDSINGVKLQLLSKFDDEIEKIIERENVESLMLSQWLGWETESLDFLQKFRKLKALYIFDSNLTDISYINQLTELEVLYLECPKLKKGIQFDLLKNLKDVRIDWRPCFADIGASNSIETLLLNGYKGEELSPILISSLKRLDLIKPSKLENLNGIDSLHNLKSLSLYQCRKLINISQIKNLSIENLEVEGCKNIQELELVFSLSNLKSLVLENNAPVSSITGVVNQQYLEKLRISSTLIEDGNVTELLEFKGTDLFFDNKKSYSHTLANVKEAINVT